MGRERIEGHLRGDTVIETSVELAGVQHGRVTVSEGAHLTLTGTVREDVVNDGGTVEVYGSIDGRLVYNAGTIYVNSDAVIAGDIVEPR